MSERGIPNGIGVLRDLLLNMGNDTIPEDYDAALAALDALVAERDKLRKTLDEIYYGAGTMPDSRIHDLAREALR